MKKIKLIYRLLKIRKISAKKRRMKVLEYDPFEILDFDHSPIIPYNEEVSL
ncbi:MAG: hypothetical protein ACI8P3_002557 [Saprospiraceae bacterium]|jgi:hypothetical protein